MSTSKALIFKKTREDRKWSSKINFALSSCLIPGCNCQADEPYHRTIPSDPLMLDEPCAMKILSFLSAKELLDVMEVSSWWRFYIESRNLLMKRICNGILVTVNFGFPVTVYEDYDYKHMELIFPKTHALVVSKLRAIDSNFLLQRYGSSLETLRITHDCHFGIRYRDLNYLTSCLPVLKQLRLVSIVPSFDLLQRSFFPMLEVLHMKIKEEEIEPMNVPKFKKFLLSFPKLKHLMIEFGNNVGTFLADTGDISFIPLVIDEDQPRLETIAFPYSTYAPLFLRGHHEALTKLSICEMDTRSLSYCFRDLKLLKCLSIWVLRDAASNNEDDIFILPEHHSLEVLKIQSAALRSVSLSEVLFKLPSLIELAVHQCRKFQKIDLRFIASNNRHLKRILMGNTHNNYDYFRILSEIQYNSRHYINSTFEIQSDLLNGIDYEGNDWFCI